MKPSRRLWLPPIVDVAAGQPAGSWLTRLAWMLAFWTASVLALTAVAGVIKLALSH